MDTAIWIGIVICLLHSGMFSGLNLAMLGLSRLHLEAEAIAGNEHARRVLALRRNSNYLLTTVLWGNVAVNTLLTLLSDSVLAGVGAFFFSTVGITIVGEIVPQAYFSRNALRVGARLAPVLRFYQVLLAPVALPSAWILDRWLGPEGILFLRERDLREIIRLHTDSDDAELSRVEGIGALNFLAFDDLPVEEEGEPVDPESIIQLPVKVDLPIFPAISRNADDPFLRRLQFSGRKWVILTDAEDQPQLVVDSNALLRAALFEQGELDPYAFCHRPIVVDRSDTRLGLILHLLRVAPDHSEDDVVDQDVILLWTQLGVRRVLTGSDLLGRLLRGIVTRQNPVPQSPPASSHA